MPSPAPSSIPQLLSDAIESIGSGQRPDISTFHFFDNAPNPILVFEDMVIGFPLFSTVAEAITKVAPQVGMDSQSTVSGPHELQANGIEILSQHWDPWISTEVLPLVLKGLSMDESMPVGFELTKMSLYKEGTQSPHLQDDLSEPDVIARMAMVLPSKFTGGSISLSNERSERSFDLGGPQSLLRTSCVAWYPGVQRSVAPITNGYILILEYKITLKDATYKKPSYATEDQKIEDLARVLRLWDKYASHEESPKILGWILNSEHIGKALIESVEMFEGIDKTRFMSLLDLAQDIGFEIYLARTKLHTTTKKIPARANTNSDSGNDTTGDIVETSCIAQELVNAKTGGGLPPFLKWKMDPNNDIIPCGFFGRHDAQKIEKAEKNGSNTPENVSCHTAILLWPSSVHIKVVMNGFSGYQIYSALFLQEAFWSPVDIAQGRRIKFGDNLFTLLEQEFEKNAIEYNGDYGPYIALLIFYATEERRLDLLRKLIKMCQLSALSVLGLAENTEGLDNQVNLLLSLCDARESGQLLAVLTAETEIAVLLSMDMISNLSIRLGEGVFQEFVLPNLEKSFARTKFWLKYWDIFPASFSDTISKVVAHHQPGFSTTSKTHHIASASPRLFGKCMDRSLIDLAASVMVRVAELPEYKTSAAKKLGAAHKNTFVQVVKFLSKALRSANVSPLTSPFPLIFKKIVLRHILPGLGPKLTQNEKIDYRLPPVTAPGAEACCSDCQELDDFLQDPLQLEMELLMGVTRRNHLEEMLKNHTGKISMKVISGQMRQAKTRPSVRITKTKFFTDKTGRWVAVRDQILNMFKSIGNDEMRAQVFNEIHSFIETALEEKGRGWTKEIAENAEKAMESEMEKTRIQLEEDAGFKTADEMDEADVIHGVDGSESREDGDCGDGGERTPSSLTSLF
ncbi:hypothetical protein RUND412_009238 [Rhizina undulata]